MKQLLLICTFVLFSLTAHATDCPRIISQSPYITHSLQWLGLEKCIVGVSKYDRLDLPHTGGILDPDKDAIDSLMPDIIFTSNWTEAKKLSQVTPEGAHSYRLHGFNTMNQIEDNLLTIGKIAGIADIQQRVKNFHNNWIKAATKINAQGKKALLISSCSGTPYSFGKTTWLYDLFSQAGFQLVETHNKVRHLKKGNEIEEITSLLNRFKPEILFIFERSLDTQCSLVMPEVPVQIVSLDGE